MLEIETTAVRVKPKRKPYTIPLLVLIAFGTIFALAYFVPIVIGISFLILRIAFVVSATFLPLIVVPLAGPAQLRISDYLGKMLLLGAAVIGVSMMFRSLNAAILGVMFLWPPQLISILPAVLYYQRNNASRLRSPQRTPRRPDLSTLADADILSDTEET